MGLPPDYVLDRMAMYEVNGLLEYRHLKDKNDWDRMRWMGTLYANYHSKHRIYAEDLITFPWEKGENRMREALTQEEKEKMDEYAKHMQEVVKTAKTSSVTLADIKRIEYTTVQNGK